MIIRIIPALAALLAGLSLGACGNSADQGSGRFADVLPEVQRLVRSDGAATQRLQPTSGFPGLDPALIAGLTVPLTGAYLEGSGAVAGLTVADRSANGVSWRTADNVGLTLSDTGMLLATRGLQADLQAADSRQSAALIAAGAAGTATRRHSYLDGVYRPVVLELTCTLQPAGHETLQLNGRSLRTLRIDERCEGEGRTVQNVYWRDASGPTIRQSTQWIGPGAGTVYLQRLID
jgi:hypothetical protein